MIFIRGKLFINLYQFRTEVQLESEAKFEDLVNPTRFTVAIYHPGLKIFFTKLVNTQKMQNISHKTFHWCGFSTEINWSKDNLKSHTTVAIYHLVLKPMYVLFSHKKYQKQMKFCAGQTWGK